MPIATFGWNPQNGSSPKRRVHVLRGFNGVDPQTLTRVAPVASGVTVYSGQVISLNNTGEWVLGQYQAGRTCYIALSNSADTDVVSCGKLPGLSCAGEFEIEMAWFDSGNFNYARGFREIGCKTSEIEDDLFDLDSRETYCWYIFLDRDLHLPA